MGEIFSTGKKWKKFDAGENFWIEKSIKRLMWEKTFELEKCWFQRNYFEK